MIEKLTKKQIEQIAVYKNEWLEKGLSVSQDSTDEDFKKCFESVEILVGEKLNGFCVCDSPSEILKKLDSRNKKRILNDSCYGQWEACWLSYYKFFRDECGVKLIEEFNHFLFLAEHVCWIYIDNSNKIVYFSAKPIEIHMKSGLLNNESGPSVLFKDGFSVWSIEGHRVSKQIVLEPETLTIKQIHNEKNSDIQTIMINRLGWDKYVELSNANLLDSRKNDIENTVEALYATDRFGLRLFCTCPTGRVFVKGVPPNVGIDSCQGAQNWLSGYQRGNAKKFQTIGRT